jgi:hypothetical protein
MWIKYVPALACDDITVIIEGTAWITVTSLTAIAVI